MGKSNRRRRRRSRTEAELAELDVLLADPVLNLTAEARRGLLAVLADPRLSQDAKQVYLALVSLADDKGCCEATDEEITNRVNQMFYQQPPERN
jgi:hypothetical protein